jgi:Flp pilus assembly protein TadG
MWMRRGFKIWLSNNDASAAVEAAFLFPLMVTILIGTIDVGVGVTVSAKVLNASQQMVDILTRGKTVSTILLQDAAVAANLALQPYNTTSLGYDVESVYLNGASATPTLEPCALPCSAWHSVSNMSRNTGILDTLATAGYVGEQDEGLIAVTVKYTYTPLFTQIIAGSINIQEVSFARGRFGGFITRTYCGGSGEPAC